MKKTVIFMMIFVISMSLLGQTASSLYSQDIDDEAVKLAEKGQKSLDKGDLKKAEKYFEKAIAIDDRAYHAYAYLGVIEGMGNQNEKAVERFKESVEKFVVFKERLVERKTDYLKTMELDFITEQHNIDRRTTNYDTAGSGNPALMQSNVNTKKDRVKQLKKDLEKDKALTFPAFFSFKYGNSLMKLKQVDQARLQYEAAVVADPEFKDTYPNLAVVYFMGSNCDKALSTYQKGKKLGAEFHPAFVKDLLANCK